MKRSGRSDLFESGAAKRLERIGRVIMVGSGKGGVGKSFVSCGLALSIGTIRRQTGILDVDIHGASVPEYMGLSAPLESSAQGLEPKVVRGVKVMSVSLLTGPKPVPLRGELKQSLITQLFALTNWGRLDYLIVDLPPGLGDEVLSVFRLFAARASLVLVTTPSRTALAVVSRLSELATAEKVHIDGVVLNMAFMKGASKRVYPFGKPDEGSVRRVVGADVLAELPLDPRFDGRTVPELLAKTGFRSAFDALARKIVREQARHGSAAVFKHENGR